MDERRTSFDVGFPGGQEVCGSRANGSRRLIISLPRLRDAKQISIWVNLPPEGFSGLHFIRFDPVRQHLTYRTLTSRTVMRHSTLYETGTSVNRWLFALPALEKRHFFYRFSRPWDRTLIRIADGDRRSQFHSFWHIEDPFYVVFCCER